MSLRVFVRCFVLVGMFVVTACGVAEYERPGAAEAVSSLAQTCNDAPPSTNYTCQQQKNWGKCTESWMSGFCQVTCGVCKPSGPPPATACNDAPPSPEYTCEQQKSWGKCTASWMNGYCQTVCGTCTAPPMTPTDPMTPTQPPMTPADPMTPAQPTPGERLTVRGRHLYDRCGAKVVLRGVNEMVVWSQGRDGTPEFGEISKTGANSVRIVWNSTATAEELDRVLANAQLEKMIPMVEHHGPTGDITKVPDAVDYWTRVDVAAVLQKHTKSLLLNIANEAGDWNVADADFESTYRSAISKIRAAGIKVPLVIDASGWGQNVDQLLRSAPRLFAHDPLRNVLFSIHVYPRVGTSAADFDALTRRISNLDFPVVFGEFAITNPGTCQVRLDHRALITYSLAREISWYAWSWGGVKNTDCPRDFNMTTDGTFAGLVGWGLDVAVDHPASIENTSRRPRSVELGDCF